MTTERKKLDEAREQLALSEGRKRAKKRREKQADKGDLSLTGAGRMTLKACRDDVVAVLNDYINDIKERKPKTPPKWFEHFDYHDVEATAEIALRGVLDGVGAEWTRNNLVMQLAKALNASIMHQVLNDTADGRRILRQIANRVKSKPGKRTKREIAFHIAGKRKKLWAKDAHGNPFAVVDEKAYYWRKWDKSTSVKVGGKMLAAVLKACGHVFREEGQEEATHENESSRIRLTENAVAAMEKQNTMLDGLTPQFGPMFQSPYEWGPDSWGPYDNKRVANLVPPVKHMSDGQEEAVWAAIKDGRLDDAINALNSLQGVPYAVNRYVVSAIQYVRDNDLMKKVNDFPNFQKHDEIAKVDNKIYNSWPLEDRMEFSEEREDVHVNNREVDANAVALKRNLEEATQVGNAEAQGIEGFFLPHQWDYRGRVYHTSEFGHHNTDYLRAMFMFANKAKVTRDNASFLTLQMANSYGEVDKEPFDVRQQWAVDNEEMILLCGRNYKDPEAFAFWSAADAPFQFLAVCREWFLALEAEKRGEAYYTGLPIGLDACQSGIQVYAAMGRNLEDGKRVNLTDNDRPGDLYIAVKERAEEIIERDIKKWEADGLDELVPEEFEEREKLRLYLGSAKQWQAFGLTRKTVKRNCMTWAYSSEEYGFAEQLRKEIMKPLQKRVRDKDDPLTEHPFGKDRGFRASWYLAGVNHEAITGVVKSAAAGMDFVQKIVKLCNDADIHLHYTTPLNFPVHQFYRDRKKAWKSKPKQKCGECETVFNKKDVTFEPSEDDEEKKVWTCASCGHLNKESGQWKTVSERIEMPKWDAPARKETTVQASLLAYTDDVNDGKSVRASAPNFIHSLDATILMKTALLCRERGVTDLMVVHDSFSTTIDNVQIMSAAIRESFHDLFDKYCPYTDLLQQTLARLNDVPAAMTALLKDDADITDEHRDIVEDAIEALAALDTYSEDEKKEAAGIMVGVEAQTSKAIARRYIQPIVRRIILVPQVPPRGDLDLKEVLKSQYAFS